MRSAGLFSVLPIGHRRYRRLPLGATGAWETIRTGVRLVISAFVALCPLAAQAQSPAVDRSVSDSRAQPRTDAKSLMAHQQLLQKAKQGGIDVYFVGDSITRRWGASDVQYRPLLENWKTNFFGWNAGNFGWGGDRIENILWRLENGELDSVNPKVIVVLAGINNVGTEPGDEKKVVDISKGLKQLLRTCQLKAPNATVIMMAIFPRNDNLAVIPTICRINANIAGLADGRKVRYLDINDKLADTQGRAFPGMLNPDQLHPTVRAYQVWAEALKPVLTELLGPPAHADHAPRPTGL